VRKRVVSLTSKRPSLDLASNGRRGSGPCHLCHPPDHQGGQRGWNSSHQQHLLAAPMAGDELCSDHRTGNRTRTAYAKAPSHAGCSQACRINGGGEGVDARRRRIRLTAQLALTPDFSAQQAQCRSLERPGNPARLCIPAHVKYAARCAGPATVTANRGPRPMVGVVCHLRPAERLRLASLRPERPVCKRRLGLSLRGICAHRVGGITP
jgi:hypothetical protein